MYFAWTKGHRGPIPSKVDDPNDLNGKQRKEILQLTTIREDEQHLKLDVLSLLYPYEGTNED